MIDKTNKERLEKRLTRNENKVSELEKKHRGNEHRYTY